MKDNEAIKLLGGLTFTFFIVKILKKIIKQSRPIKTKTYGMPSSRSSLLAFIITFLLLNYKFNMKTKYIIISLGLISIYMKYYLKEHSFKQLLAGIILCIIIGYIVNKCF